MAKMSKTPMLALYVDADFSEADHASGVITEFTKQMTTEAYTRHVMQTAHNIFADIVDREICLLAKNNPAAFHHVFEYNPGNDPYSWVGERHHKLWKHRRDFKTGSSLNFTWEWLPAKQDNPSYRQRRASRVGEDWLRNVPEYQFQKLLEKTAGRSYKFVWKAPTLEYGFSRRVYPIGNALIVPGENVGQKTGSLGFAPMATVTVQSPGPVRGRFTKAWTNAWARNAKDMDKILLEEIERDAARKIEQGIARGKKAGRGKRNFRAQTVTSNRVAFEAGRQQALAQMKGHMRSISQIESKRGTFHDAPGGFFG